MHKLVVQRCIRVMSCTSRERVELIQTDTNNILLAKSNIVRQNFPLVHVFFSNRSMANKESDEGRKKKREYDTRQYLDCV